MVIIMVTVSIIVTGLIVYFILANHTGNDLPSLFSKEEQGAVAAGESDTVILSKEKSGADQNRVISLFGYSDQFTVIFDESYDNKRIDTWIYFDMEAMFIFENGTYAGSEQYYGKKCQKSGYELLPQDFIYGMTLLEVEALIGQEGAESFDESTGLNILTFGEGEIICIFNPDSKLIIVSKQNKLLNEI